MLMFLLNAVWQIPMIAAIAALVSRLMRACPARHRHLVWVAALVLAVFVPMYRPGRPASPTIVEVSSQTLRLPITIPLPDAVALLPSVARTTSSTRSITDLASKAYLLFVLLALGRFAWQWQRAIHLRKSAGRRALPPLLETVRERCARALGAGSVDLLVSGRISGPVTAGTAVILPASLLAETSRDVLTTAIGHEIAHVVRQDYGWNLAYELLMLPVSFHPAVWLISRGIKTSREMACDELVSRHLLEPAVYARSLVSMASAMVRTPAAGCALGAFDGSILEQRIRRLMENRMTNLRTARLLLLAGLLTLAACSFLATNIAFSARAEVPPPPVPSPAVPQAPMELPRSSPPPTNNFLAMGAAAYNGNNFEDAVTHFGNAAQFDPSDLKARIFLALADGRAYFSGGKNPALLADAIRQYQYVLERDPQNVAAVKGMTAVALNAGQFPEARQWGLRYVEVAPQDPSAYFLAALADFALATKPIQDARKKWRVASPFARHAHVDTSRLEALQIPDAETRKTLRDQLLDPIEEGVRMAQLSAGLDPASVGAVGYAMQHLILKAAILDDPAQVLETARTAEEWADKLETLNQSRFAPASPLRRIYDPISLTGPFPDPIPVVKP